MKKIKVIHIVENLPVGGLERTVYIIMRGLDRTKFDVKLWCLASGGYFADKLKEEGYDVEVLGLTSYHNARNVIALIQKIRKEKPDIIHTHGYFAGIFGRLAALLSFRKIILIHHYQTIFAEFYSKANAFLEAFFNRLTHKVICVSGFVERSYIEKKVLTPRKSQLIYNCAETGKYKFHEIMNNEKVRIAIVASLREVKGHIYLIRAFGLLKKDFDNVELHIIGDGPLRDYLRKAVNELGLENYVFFRGELDNVAEILQDMDIFVLSSIREGLPLSLVEAMASGVACVATEVGGIPEVIDDGEDGLLVPPRNPEALYRAIKYVIENPEVARKFSQKGRVKAEKIFDCKTMIEKIENLYLSFFASK